MRPEVKKIILVTAAALFCWVGIRFVLPSVMPFALGGLMALLAEPGVRFLARKVHLPRGAAAGIGVSAVFLIICTVLVMVLTLLLRELGLLAGILPDMERTVMDGLDALKSWLLELSRHASPGIRAVLERNVTDLFSGGAELLDQFTRYALGLAGTLLSHIPDSALGVGTAVLSAFLISAELPRIRQWCRSKLPSGAAERAKSFLRRLKGTLGLWLVAQLKLSGITCALLTLGFLLLRIAHAPLWAVAVTGLDALPILGTGTVLVPWSLVCLLRSDGARALGLLGLYLTASLTRSTLEPRLIGRQLGLDPLVTLIALYTGFRLFGLPGLILMPLLAITAVRLYGGEVGKE